jgi:transcription-repair coupling factor (superfamily II helicase)
MLNTEIPKLTSQTILQAKNFFTGEVGESITKFKTFLEEQRKIIVKTGETRKKIIIACKSVGVLEGLKRLLDENEINYIKLESFANLKDISAKYIGLALYEIEEAFETKDFILISENFLIGKQIANVKRRKQINLIKLKTAANQFDKGDLVVHKEYGIGIFEGVFALETSGHKYDAVKIVYQNSDALYVPIYNINQVSKFGGEIPPEERLSMLDKLGGTSFKMRKAKAKIRIFAIAENLMKLAAKRSLIQAPVFHKIPGAYEEFEKAFPFELTEDQEVAIYDVISDLSSGKPMDRLICGDVGFGKTEVAMRASFVAIAGKFAENQAFGQVAIVVPTTILARQHFNNFIERFKGTNIQIRELSRNVSTKQKEEIFLETELGEVDILIGTHALFSEKLKFKNLSLLIIDEEQHFGVKQKEKLKEGKEGVHFLSLSATPIPRTLQMSLSGLRDISIISTPPFDRLLPKTFLMPYDLIVLSSAITREKARNGRVFFVCPRISDLEEQKAKLEMALPEVRFVIAHGRMTGNQIEDIMLKFYEGFIDCLVTTSIIESGVDISFANTIIIYRAEMFGLSGLYQLRGRVGRSSVQSYAYLIVDEKKMVDGSNTKNRLEAIANLKSLGSGFKIAGADMDIRGAGNLIGEEQAGKINDVGVELYQEMLQEAVMKLKTSGENFESEEDFTPEIKIGMGVMIPENYIPDFNLRLEFYRRISAASSFEEIEELNREMEDRFGALPVDAKNLFDILKLKLKCKEIGITKLEVGNKGAVAIVRESVFKGGEKLFEFAMKNPKMIKLNQEGKINFYDSGENLLEKANKVLKILSL